MTGASENDGLEPAYCTWRQNLTASDASLKAMEYESDKDQGIRYELLSIKRSYLGRSEEEDLKMGID